MPGQGRLGDKATVPTDAHGCPACPHTATGPAIRGSPNVNVNHRPALRVDDPGIHAACCGANTWTATTGSTSVFINGKAAHRVGDQNRHCGGTGQLVEGSQNVIVGEGGAGGVAPPSISEDRKGGWIEIALVDDEGEPRAGERYVVTTSDGRRLEGHLDDSGHARLDGLRPGSCKIQFPDLHDTAWF